VEERFNFNTAISAIMELSNSINSYRNQEELDLPVLKEAIDTMLLLLSPFSPHITEELWQYCGHQDSIYNHSWPRWDESALIKDEVEIALQVLGKVRDRVMVPSDISNEELEKIALANERVQEFSQGKQVVKLIVVPGKLVNVVVK
jgi:leucyl-tRNA synthetase